MCALNLGASCIAFLLVAASAGDCYPWLDLALDQLNLSRSYSIYDIAQVVEFKVLGTSSCAFADPCGAARQDMEAR